MDQPSISVVIPAYNAERFIGDALQSVFDQSKRVSEIVVVDNSSSDDTAKIARKLGATVVEEAERGVSAARNRGIERARMDWIAFMDADDVWSPDKIECQMKALELYPAARIITCDSGRILPNEDRKREVPVLVDPGNLEGVETDGPFSFTKRYDGSHLGWFLINSSTALLHREVFQWIGNLNVNLEYAQDMEFMFRALKHFPVATVKRNLAYIRWHGENRTKDAEAYRGHKNEVLKMIKNAPDQYPEGLANAIIVNEKLEFLEWIRGFQARIHDNES
ncbi:MAG: glycosyltransferase family 2 protein [Pyrinomonadaceae bacterium]|nr:glycosyltransferase family 2 protein [Pyrinomonadaceae bacterium]